MEEKLKHTYMLTHQEPVQELCWSSTELSLSPSNQIFVPIHQLLYILLPVALACPPLQRANLGLQKTLLPDSKLKEGEPKCAGLITSVTHSNGCPTHLRRSSIPSTSVKSQKRNSPLFQNQTTSLLNILIIHTHA